MKTWERIGEVEQLLQNWHEADRRGDAVPPNKGYADYNREHAKTWKDGYTFLKLNDGTSGAFMLEKATGKIYCIKSYGVVDSRKCVGLLGEVTGASLVKNRWWNLTYQKVAV